MSLDLRHECTRVPVTAVTFCNNLFIAGEGPLLRFFHSQTFEHITTTDIFQSHVIHGISICIETQNYGILLVWAGFLVRAVKIRRAKQTPINVDDFSSKVSLELILSPIIHAPDWILDLACNTVNPPQGYEEGGSCRAAAVTARNALLEFIIVHRNLAAGADGEEDGEELNIQLAELTAASRCILYSAHVVYDTSDRILIAAGTAFGEVLVWSWTRKEKWIGSSRTHQVFLGHEGSIFGVCISENISSSGSAPQRLLASCSDDRTIRVWKISDVSAQPVPDVVPVDGEDESNRTRHTGFKAADENMESSQTSCLAIGWGHTSRVWTVRFCHPALDAGSNLNDLHLVSTGEDATYRLWELTHTVNVTSTEDSQYPLKLISTAAHHSGKNIWSSVVFAGKDGIMIVSGAADSKITISPLLIPGKILETPEYTIQDLVSSISTPIGEAVGPSVVPHPPPPQKASKTIESFRSYSFVNADTILITTSLGNIYLANVSPSDSSPTESMVSFTFLQRLDDLRGFALSAGLSSAGLIFLAGARGTIYTYHKDSMACSPLWNAQAKVANLLAATIPDSNDAVLLVTTVGPTSAQLLFLECSNSSARITYKVAIPLSEHLTGSTVTAMLPLSNPDGQYHVFLGFRRGTIAVCGFSRQAEAADSDDVQASPIMLIDQAHIKESVTAMLWNPSGSHTALGQLLSIGRDGSCTIHQMDLATRTAVLVHRIALPTGTDLEGMYIHHGHLMIYGFQSTKFILYDSTTEEGVLEVECGGARRSWAFQTHASNTGGTLVWTRGSSMHIHASNKPSHHVVRTGGHGREIKAVAVSPTTNGSRTAGLVATGAEDTDIKIFRYGSGESHSPHPPNFTCIRTLRKHNTGIQHLQWSSDGEYLFSSGGFEEFFAWKITLLPIIGLGVVCESVCVPNSEHSDLRIMSFDVRKSGSAFLICMVLSNSTIRFHSYDPAAEVKWQILLNGVYGTSCLTQTMLFDDILVTLGTDGYVTSWPLPFAISNHIGGVAPVENRPLGWVQRAKLHQNSSKSLASHQITASVTLIASGGDDGGLGMQLVHSDTEPLSTFSQALIVPRAHASAVSACILWAFGGDIFLLTSGNDQWVRLWQVTVSSEALEDGGTGEEFVGGENSDFEVLDIKRISKMKTSVADVSSMAILKTTDRCVKVGICGVGMEVVSIEN